MIRNRIPAVLAVALVCAGGCGERNPNPKPNQPIEVPAYALGTVSQYAVLVETGWLPVEGYGVVVGLGRNGSSEIPPHIEQYLIQELARAGVGAHDSSGRPTISPQVLLRDPDTAAVRVSGLIPPGAPRGVVFDIHIEALPGTQTVSLDGGALWPTELSLAVPGADPSRVTLQRWAWAQGSTFVNPFVDPTDLASMGELREARIIGGGVVSRARPIRLQLIEPDYLRANVIRDQINRRFGRSRRDATSRQVTANAISSAILEINVPAVYERDHNRFLELLMHLPVHTDIEAHARALRDAAAEPDAEHHHLMLVLEAMGRQVLPQVLALYTSEHPSVAFHAARTGLRLGDQGAAIAVLMDFARKADSPFRLPAIDELGRSGTVPRVLHALRDLLDDEDELVRMAAYEALLRQDDRDMVQRHRVGNFVVDVVASSTRYTVYAMQSEQPRLVLFGRGMSLSRPMFYNSADDLVTIDCPGRTSLLRVHRKIPYNDTYTPVFETGPDVLSLIRTLGERPQSDPETGQIQGLGLTYGQVVRVLHDLSERQDLRAGFVLRQPRELQEEIAPRRTAGRPDIGGY